MRVEIAISLPDRLLVALERIALALARSVSVGEEKPHAKAREGDRQEGAPHASPAEVPRAGSCEVPGALERDEPGLPPQVLPPSSPTAAAVPAAVTGKFRRDHLKSYRTAERSAVLAAAWPGAETMAAVLVRLNAMDGPPVPPGAGAVYRWAAALGLGDRPNRPPAAGRAAAGRERQPLWRTAEREALLRELWPQVVPVREIHARLNALPGPALPAVPDNVSQWGYLLGLQGRPGREIQALVNRRGDGLVAPKRTQAEAVAASNQARGAALVRERVEAGPPAAIPAAVPVPPEPAEGPRPVPELPAPVDGVVYASFREVQAWAGYFGVGYDGGNMDRVNKLRAAKGLCRLVQSEDRAA